MLGYSTKDVEDMQNAIELAPLYIPDNSSNDEVRRGLEMASSFFEGLWAEGYFD